MYWRQIILDLCGKFALKMGGIIFGGGRNSEAVQYEKHVGSFGGAQVGTLLALHGAQVGT